MKSLRYFILALAAALAIAAINTTAWATPPPKECSLMGTWSGFADGGTNDTNNATLAWSAVHTPGNSNTTGEMLLNWVYVNPSLLQWWSHYNAAVVLTPGHGVWEEVRKNQYKYTWYAYGMDANGTPVYSVRVSGLANNTDCNNVNITYYYEIFDGWVTPQQMSQLTPAHGTAGSAAETRVLVVTPPSQ